MDISYLEKKNIVDPDQLASKEASWSGSTLFSMQPLYPWNHGIELTGTLRENCISCSAFEHFQQDKGQYGYTGKSRHIMFSSWIKFDCRNKDWCAIEYVIYNYIHTCIYEKSKWVWPGNATTTHYRPTLNDAIHWNTTPSHEDWIFGLVSCITGQWVSPFLIKLL